MKFCFQNKLGILAICSAGILSSRVEAQTGKTSQKESIVKREAADDAISAALVGGELLLLGFGHSKILQINGEIISRSIGAGNQRYVLLRRMLDGVEKLGTLKKEIAAVPSNPKLTEPEKVELLAKLKKNEEQWIRGIKSVPFLNPKMEVKIKNLLDQNKLEALADVISREKFEILGKINDDIDAQIRGNKKIKALKTVVIVGGVLFAVDITGHVWAWAEDKPAPTMIPGQLSVELLAKGASDLYEGISNLVKSPEAQKVLNEKDRGTPGELLNEAVPPVPAKKDH